MKLRKRIISMIIGFTMVFGVGCNKTEKAEELIKENVECLVERNLEEYNSRYNYLNEYEQLNLDIAKEIDFSKSEVKIEEIGKVYQIKIFLKYTDNTIKENDTDIYTLEINKNDFNTDNLKDVDLLYNDNIKVVAIENNYSKMCTKDYRDRKEGFLIYDEYTLKEYMLVGLGDIEE